MTKWQVVSASVVGTSHKKLDTVCQDSHYWEILPQGILVAAVADGAGSATLADIGSEIAVKTAVKTIRQSLTYVPNQDEEDWKSCLSNVLKITQEAIFAEAKTREVSARELATTLILVVAMPNLVVGVQIGDGAAVLGNHQGETIGLTIPASGEHINETNFIIANDALDMAQYQILPGEFSHLAIFSDGLQLLALKMPEGTPHQPFFTPLFKFVANLEDVEDGKQQLESFLNSPRVTERTDDDLTLLLACLIK